MNTGFSSAIFENIKNAFDNENYSLLKKMIREEHVRSVLIDSPELLYKVLIGIVSQTEQKRGRPKKKKISNVDNERYYQNLACKLKSYLTGESFSSLWEGKYLKSTKRPVQTELDIFQCSTELLHAVGGDDPFAGTKRHKTDAYWSNKARKCFELNYLEVEAIDWFNSNRTMIVLETFIDLYHWDYVYDDYSEAYYVKYIDNKDFPYYVCVDDDLLKDFKRFRCTIENLLNSAQ